MSDFTRNAGDANVRAGLVLVVEFDPAAVSCSVGVTGGAVVSLGDGLRLGCRSAAGLAALAQVCESGAALLAARGGAR